MFISKDEIPIAHIAVGMDRFKKEKKLLSDMPDYSSVKQYFSIKYDKIQET